MNDKPDEAGVAGEERLHGQSDELPTPGSAEGGSPAGNRKEPGGSGAGPDDPPRDAADRDREEEPAAADGGAHGGRVSRERPARAGFSGVAAALALLLALAAVAGVGYLFWQDRYLGSERANTDAAVAALADNLEESLETLDGLRRRLAALAESDADYGDELESLERQLDDLLGRYENIPARLSSLESSMASLQGISTGVRDNWWLAEAEYYMQIANAQLQLAGNPQRARLALQFADERIRQLGNPALSGVRRALALELRALAAMERPDVEGISLELASLAETVGALPLAEDAAAGGRQRPAIAEDAGPLDRAVASLRRAFGEIVSVRRSDERVRPLMSPEAGYFLRTNLALQIQAARLALLRGEQGVFEQSLADAESWLGEYYERDSAAVRSARATVDEIRRNAVAIEPPDISQSLSLLRQYRTRSTAGTSTATEDRTGSGDDDRDGSGSVDEERDAERR